VEVTYVEHFGSTVSISRLASDLLGRGGFVGFPELQDAGEIASVVFLQYKKIRAGLFE
jgi:hypothetical protein